VRDKSQILEREARWSVPAGALTFLAIVLLIVGAVVSAAVSGEDKAEILRSAHEHSSSLIAGSLLQALGFILLAVPLVVLFKAAQARSERVRPQLIGLIAVAPLFFGIATGLNGFATTDAADQFVAGEAKPGISVKAATADCQDELVDKGGEKFNDEHGGGNPSVTVRRCAEEKAADEEAENAVSEASLTGPATGFGLAGKLGLAIALLYVGLWGMRTGLLTRFWGSLGMALGVAALLGLVIFLVVWFAYVALLLAGIMPGGKPSAWAAGEAIPWPTPGEKAAAELEPEDDGSEDAPDGDGDGEPPGERRKRKQRD